MPTSDDVLEALGDGLRRAILELLRAEERSLGELARSLPISRPAVSQHLRVLREAGLVAQRAEGIHRVYRVDDTGLDLVRDYPWTVLGHHARPLRRRRRRRHRPERRGANSTEPGQDSDCEP